VAFKATSSSSKLLSLKRKIAMVKMESLRLMMRHLLLWSRRWVTCLSREEALRIGLTTPREMSNQGGASIVIAPIIFKMSVSMRRRRTTTSTRGESLRRRKERQE